MKTFAMALQWKGVWPDRVKRCCSDWCTQINQNKFVELVSKTAVNHTIPPGTKPIHAGKKSWGINFWANTCGACIRTRANTENIFEEPFFAYWPNSWGNSFQCKYMSRLYSYPREYWKKFLANYLCIGFVPGVTKVTSVSLPPCMSVKQPKVHQGESKSAKVLQEVKVGPNLQDTKEYLNQRGT